ncbi:MAG: pantetheine-phosphate adenylyltransferase [Candidatus Nanohaloarchaea archaeon]
MAVYRPDREDRKKLKEPKGEVHNGKKFLDALREEGYSKIIAVGDHVSQHITESEIEADIYITDGKNQREKLDTEITPEADREFTAENPAGEISREAWKAVRKASALSCTTHVKIQGEEDLLALPATIFAPENSVIIYGQRNRGAVLMEPEDNREFCQELVDLDTSEHLIVGGSWDRFHSGHRYILEAAAERGEKIDIGISSDEMLKEKIGSEPHHSFKEREENVTEFLKGLGIDEFDTIELNGIYGNAVEEGETLIVTPETLENGRKINAKREELGREKLELEVIEKLKACDGKIISSTRIRNNEIDENGLEP